MEIGGLPDELAQYLDLCFESVERVTERRDCPAQPLLTPAHTTEFYALRTASRR